MNRRFALGALPALLSGCYIGWDHGDELPSVSLAVARTSALPGEVVRLAAAASDDDFVDEVEFYRIDPDGRRFYLGVDGRDPFEWDAVMPNFARGEVVYFFARAFDSWGQSRDSDRVPVTLL